MASWLRHFGRLTLAVLFACGQASAGEVVLSLRAGGAGSLVNTSLDRSVILTSYFISRSDGGVELSPTWDSFQSQGLPFEVTARTVDLLSEVTTTGGLLFNPGESKSIGVPFSLSADADGNGIVDLNDFGIWKSNVGQPLDGPSVGDFDYNGVVDEVDFDFLLNQMGGSAAYTFSATTVVPEASSFGMFGLSSAGLAAVARRHPFRLRRPR